MQGVGHGNGRQDMLDLTRPSDVENLPVDVDLLVRAVRSTQRSIVITEWRNGDSLIVYANEAFERMTGHSAKAILGKDCLFFQGPETDQSSVRQLREAMRQRSPVTVTLLSYRRDGSQFWNEFSLAPLPDTAAQGPLVESAVRMVGVCVDVTASVLAQRDLERAYASERRAHDEARTARKKLEAILSELPAGVLVAEAPGGRLLRGNAQMEEIFRHPFLAASTTDAYERYVAFHRDGRRYLGREWPLARSVLFGEVVPEEEIRIRRGDGTYGTVLARSSPIHDDSGNVVAAIMLLGDITARKEAELELHRARERSAALARTLQQSLLPADLPVVEGLEFGAAYSPVSEGLDVGGDFYDVFEHRDGEWMIAIGDVMGKGAEAASVTALARHTLRAAAIRARRPSTLLNVLNQALVKEGDRPFCTVAMGTLTRTPQGARLLLSLGGHLPPLLVRRDGSIDFVGDPGTLIGVFDSLDLTEVEVLLEPGDALVLYTDGVTEARLRNDFLGEEGLLDIVKRVVDHHPSAQDLACAVQDEVLAFAGAGLKDDLAVLVLKVLSGASDNTVHL